MLEVMMKHSPALLLRSDRVYHYFLGLADEDTGPETDGEANY